MDNFEKILVLINSEGKQKRIDYIIDFLHDKFRESIEIGHMIIYKTIDSSSTKFISKEFSNYFSKSLIIAVGGDGTIHEIVNSINFNNTSLALLPNGTGNDFANKLYGTTDLQVICNKLLDPDFIKTDLIKVNDYYCVNVLSFGYDTTILKKSLQIKSKYSFLRGLSFKLAILLTISKIEAVDYEYSFRLADGRLVSSNGSYIINAICNGSRFGGGFMPAPTAQIDDGIIEINQLENIGILRLANKIPSYLNGSHIDKVKEIHNYKAISGKIIPKDEKISGNIDGELYEFEEIDFKVMPNVLRIMR